MKTNFQLSGRFILVHRKSTFAFLHVLFLLLSLVSSTSSAFACGGSGSCNSKLLKSNLALVCEIGTVFYDDGNVVYLLQGKMALLNGNMPATIHTVIGDVLIAKQSTVIVEATPQILRAQNLDGSPTVIKPSGPETEVLSTRSGEEMCIGGTPLSDEELVPVDGVYRWQLKCTSKIENRKLVKNVFDRKMACEKEKLFVCNVKARQISHRINRLKEKIAELTPELVVPIDRTGCEDRADILVLTRNDPTGKAPTALHRLVK